MGNLKIPTFVLFYKAIYKQFSLACWKSMKLFCGTFASVTWSLNYASCGASACRYFCGGACRQLATTIGQPFWVNCKTKGAKCNVMLELKWQSKDPWGEEPNIECTLTVICLIHYSESERERGRDAPKLWHKFNYPI